MKSDLIDIKVFIHHETEKAVLVEDLDGMAGKVWLPKSAVEIDGRGAVVEITLPRSLAEEKGLA